MKRAVKASKFETKVCLVDKYGDVVCELKPNESWWVIPRDICEGILMDVDDEYHVEEIEFEVD